MLLVLTAKDRFVTMFQNCYWLVKYGQVRLEFFLPLLGVCQTSNSGILSKAVRFEIFLGCFLCGTLPGGNTNVY